MKRSMIFVLLMALVGLVASCAAPAGNNATTANANKPANNAAAAPAADAAAIETEIKKLANDGVAAVLKNDTEALSKLWDDKYVFVGQDGAVSTKAQRIESMKSGQSKIETLSYDEMTVRSNSEGTGAVLVGRVTVKGTNMGKAVDGQMRFTQVWSRTKDGWKLVSGQVTPITAASSAPASNSANTASNANK